MPLTNDETNTLTVLIDAYVEINERMSDEDYYCCNKCTDMDEKEIGELRERIKALY